MKAQRGGFAVGLVVGLVLGLLIAMGVALYVNKVPIPFVNKVSNRTPEQDAAEAERNRNWDPNAPLAGKPAPRAASGAVTAAPTAPTSLPSPTPPATGLPPIAATPGGSPASASQPAPAGRDPASILAGEPSPAAANPAAAASRAARAGPDPFSYFVQVGAYARPEDAEQQRARLAMLGMGARVTEREQAGRTVYRVRLGPFERKDEADGAQERLQGSGIESALVRVER